MKKILICLIFLWVLPALVFGQSKNNSKDSHTVNTAKKMEDVVYLKNGAIIRGIIIEQIPNKRLEIKSNDNNFFIFKLASVFITVDN